MNFEAAVRVPLNTVTIRESLGLLVDALATQARKRPGLPRTNLSLETGAHGRTYADVGFGICQRYHLYSAHAMRCAEALGHGPGMESAWMHQTSASPARMEFTTSHQVPVSIPEQAISCEGREGNGKLVAASPLRHMRERQPDSEEQVGAKGVTAGETASIYDLVV